MEPFCTIWVNWSQTFSRMELKIRINCSIPVFDAISVDSKTLFEECPTRADAKRTEKIYEKLYFDLRERPESFGCPMPCTRVTYDLHVSYYHENTADPVSQESNFTLLFYSSSNFIEDQVI